MKIRFRRAPRTGEVTLPVAEWHATTLAIDGLVDHNDELQRQVDRQVETIRQLNALTDGLLDQRDRARRWAVALEQDCADLEAANTELRANTSLLVSRLTWHHRGTHFDTLCQGCEQQRAADADEVHGVPA